MKFYQPMFWEVCGPAFSMALEDGPSPSDSQAGEWTDLFGAPLSPVSPSVAQAKEMEPQTSGTSGPSSTGSSASAALQSSLESKCRELLAKAGSMEYSQTWREKATPAGRSYLAHTASARRTSGSGCSGWPTPNVPNGGRQASEESMTSTGLKPDGRKGQVDLNFTAKLAGWPTPDCGVTGAKDAENRQGGASLAAMAGWATPLKRDGEKSEMAPEDYHEGTRGMPLGLEALSFIAGMGKSGGFVLNPAFSRWLQNYPQSWDHCSPGWKHWESMQKLLAETESSA